MTLTELTAVLALLLSSLGCTCLAVILSRKICRGLYDILKHSTILISDGEDFVPRDLTIVALSAIERQGNSAKVLPGPAGEGSACSTENSINLEELSIRETAGNSRRESFLDPVLIRNCGQSHWSMSKDISKDFQSKDDELQSTDGNTNDCNYVDFVPCRDKNIIIRSCNQLDGSLNVLKNEEKSVLPLEYLEIYHSYEGSKMECVDDENNEKSRGIPLLDEEETQLEVNRSQLLVETFKWKESKGCHDGRTSLEEMVNQLKQEIPMRGTESTAEKLDVNEESSHDEVGHLKQSRVVLQGENRMEKPRGILSVSLEFMANRITFSQEDESINHSRDEMYDVRGKCKYSEDETNVLDVNVKTPTFDVNYPRASLEESESDCRIANVLRDLSKESDETLTQNRKASSTERVRNDLLPKSKNLLVEEHAIISPIYSISHMKFEEDSSKAKEQLSHTQNVSLSYNLPDSDMEIFSQADNTFLITNSETSLSNCQTRTIPFKPKIRPMHVNEEFDESYAQTEPGPSLVDSCLLNKNFEISSVNSEVKVKLAVNEVELANDFQKNVFNELPNLKMNNDACSSKFYVTNDHETFLKDHSKVSKMIPPESNSIDSMLERVCTALEEIKLNDLCCEKNARCIKEVDRLSAENDTNHWKAEPETPLTGEINLRGTPFQEDTSHYAKDPGTPTRKDTDGLQEGIGPPPEFDKNQLHGESGYFSSNHVNHIEGEIESRDEKSTSDKEYCAENPASANRSSRSVDELVSSEYVPSGAKETCEPRVDRGRSKSDDICGTKYSSQEIELSATSAEYNECQDESTRGFSLTPVPSISFPDTQHQKCGREEQNLNSIVRRLIAVELMKHHEKQQVIMKRAHSDSGNIVSQRKMVSEMQTMSKLPFALATFDATHEMELDDSVKASAQYIKHNLKNDKSQEEILNDSQQNTSEVHRISWPDEKNYSEDGNACVARPTIALEHKEVFPSLFEAKVRTNGETTAIETKECVDSNTQTEHVYMIRAVRSCPIRRRQYSLFLHLQRLMTNPTPTPPDLSKLIHRKASDNLIYEKAKGFSSPSYVPAPERFRWRYLTPRKLD